MEKRKARYLYIIVVVLWILFAYLAIDEPVAALISGTVFGIFVAASLVNLACHITRTDKERFHAYGWLVSAFVYGIYLTVLYKGDMSKLFSFNTYGSKTKALKAAKEYRDNQEVILAHKYQLRFDLGYNPKKESVWLGCTVKTSGEYWNWIASYYHPVKKIQSKKTYSINKYGTREAKRLAYKWRDEQRSQDEVHIAN